MDSLTDDWDPMEEDFYDPSFNAYLDGPGARLDHNLQPWARMRRNKGPYKLHVCNIPVQITKDGLTNIFCRYGDLLSVYKHEQFPLGSPVTWGLIVFARHSEAELAIRELNNKKPYYLRVRFALSDAEKEKQRLEREKMVMWESAKAAEALVHPDGFLREAPLRRRSDIGCGRGRFMTNYLNNYSYHPNGFEDGYSDEDFYDPFEECNKMMMESVHYNSKGRDYGRRVFMGRGHTNISAHVPGNRNSAVRGNHSSDEDFSSTEHGVYTFGRPVHLEAGVVGPCQFCSKMTSSACKRCGDFYCSVECQKKDWPNHKPYCIAIPGVVSKLHDTSLLSNENGSSSDPKSPNIHKNVNQQITNTPSKDVFTTTETNDVSVSTEDHTLGHNQIIDPKVAEDRLSASFSAGKTPDRTGRNNKTRESNSYTNEVDQLESTPSHKSGVNQRKTTESSEHYDKCNASGYDLHQNSSSYMENRTSCGNLGRSGYRDSATSSGSRYNNQNNRNEQQSRSSWGGSSLDTRKGSGANPNSSTKRQWNHNDNSNFSQNDRRHFNNRSDRRQDNRDTNVNDRRENHSRNDSRQSNDYSQNNRRSNGRDQNNYSRQKYGQDSERKSFNRQTSDNQSWSRSSYQHKDQGLNKIKDITESTSTEMPDPDWEVETSSSTVINSSIAAEEPVKNPECHPTPVLSSEELPQNIFTDVKVALNIACSEYWVQKIENEEQILENMKILQESTKEDLQDAKVGMFCSALYEGVWYRAKIIEVTPVIKVHYVDYGNEENCTMDSIKVMPIASYSLPAQAVKIKLAEGTSEKYHNLSEESTLRVKPFKSDCGTVVVLVEGENYSELQKTEKSSESLSHEKSCFAAGSDTVVDLVETVKHSDLQKSEDSLSLTKENDCSMAGSMFSAANRHSTESALKLLSSGMAGAIHVRSVENPNQFTGTVIAPTFLEQYRKIHGELCTYFEDKPADQTFKPALGDFIAAELPTDSLWHRAYVLSDSSNGYKVAFCDLGISKTVQKVGVLPEEFSGAEEMAVRCKVTKYEISNDIVREKYLKVDEQLKLEFTEVSADKVLASLLDDEKMICTVEMTRWEPIVEHGLQFAPLETKSTVVLSSFRSSRTMFVRPLDKDSIEKFSVIIQDVAGHCFKAPQLEEYPVKGEMVGCQYSKDGNYYRAKVHSFEKDKVWVFYVDFGNSELEELRQMKKLSEKLKMTPASVAKIQLKDVPELPLNKEITHFLSEITLKEKEMRIEFSDLKEGVDLYIDGSHVNAKLKSMLEPSWKENEKDSNINGLSSSSAKRIYFYDDLTFVELPVGETVELRICYIEQPNIVFGFREGSDVMQYIMTKLQADMNEYCSNVDKDSFLPRKYEMCLAKYEGAWYRAMCLDTVDAAIVSVFFVDYGNKEVVPNDDVRKIVADFMETPVAVTTCTVKDISQDDPKANEKLLDLVEKVRKVEILSMEKNGFYEVGLCD